VSAFGELAKVADNCFAHSVPMQEATRKGGVYFLMCGEQIAYVGLSCNVKRRVYQHRRNMVQFDSVRVNQRGNAVRETLCIKRFNPPFNAPGMWRRMNRQVPKTFDARRPAREMSGGKSWTKN
jgi:hypothetical protein